jgi:hypothetical protein
MKKRQLIISYEIISQNCLKSIVKSVRTFDKDKDSIAFIKRLVGLKNTLCERSDKDKYIEVVKEQKDINKRARKYCSWNVRKPFNESGLPFILKYNCKTVYAN